MGFLTGKTAIITGAGRAVLSDGRWKLWCYWLWNCDSLC